MRKEKVLFDASVCFLIKDNWVLLMFKTDKIGKNCWNGPGGGIKKGEIPLEAGIRELWEESGVVAFPEFMERVAEVDFHNTKSDGSTFVCKVHYFFVSEWLGRPQSRPKEFMINPRWFPKDHLHYEMMMPADKDFMTVLFQEDMKHWFMKAQAFLGPFQAEKLKPTEIQWVER